MQPDDSILFSKRACWINTLLIVAVSFLLGTWFTVNNSPFSGHAAVSSAAFFALPVSWFFAWFAKRTVITRLKQRLPGKAREIEDYPSYTYRSWGDVMVGSVIREIVSLPFIAADPQWPRMLAEAKTFARFELLWRWGCFIPMLLLAVVQTVFS